MAFFRSKKKQPVEPKSNQRCKIINELLLICILTFTIVSISSSSITTSTSTLTSKSLKDKPSNAEIDRLFELTAVSSKIEFLNTYINSYFKYI